MFMLCKKLRNTLFGVVLLCASALAQQTIATTKVTDNGGNLTKNTIAILSTGQRAVLQVSIYTGTSTLLKSQLFCYNGAADCLTQTVTFPILSKIVYTTVGSQTSESAYTYDQYGNTLTDEEYNFGASSPTFTTTFTYGSCGQGATVSNAPCEILTKDNTAATVSDVKYIYNAAGEIITANAWNGSTYLESSATYNSNGTIATQTTIDGVLTTYTYTGTGGCPSGASMFPTSVHTGVLTSSATYNCNGGVPLSVTDTNNEVWTYKYVDPFDRMTSFETPLAYTTTTTYTPTTVESALTFGSSTLDSTAIVDSLGRASLFKVRKAPGLSSYDTTTTAYSWVSGSRVVSTTPPAAGATKYTSDHLGRNTSTVDAGGGTVTTTYTDNDALVVRGPAPAGEVIKQVQVQTDAFNRPTFTCAIESSGGTACGQTYGSASGIVTTQTYPTGLTTTQARGSQSKTLVVDTLGRQKSVTTPEAGEVTYTYDSAAAVCGTGWASGSLTSEPSQLMMITYANGNKACFAGRDSNGRLTDMKYTGTTTYCARFRYDNSVGVTGTRPTGIAPTYSMGHLVEAETDNCSVYPPTSASMLTDEWFSYDKDGRTISMWEKTPDSVGSVDGSYYLSTATYFADDSIETIDLTGTPNYTATYTKDGEGRYYSLAANGVKDVSAVSYDGDSQPTAIALGTGTDQDAFVYDPNVGRMTNWTYQVGTPTPKQHTGTVTWNANGTVRELNVVDGFNAGGTQTCTYGTSSTAGYDSIGRLLQNNCGSVWTQTFAYDNYDNLTKKGTNGGISWPPSGTTYSATNNRYTGNSSITYDGSGNLLKDTFHTYTWNGMNQLASLDSTNVVRDAFGRVVELKGTTKTEIWYTPAGKTAFMNGSTYLYAYWQAPGGETVTHVAPNTAYYQHKDWLGNTRVVSSISGQTVYADQAMAPYGEIYAKFGTSALNVQSFTGLTQDIVTGTYDAVRELNANQGRWLSTGLGHWNGYGYSTNPLVP